MRARRQILGKRGEIANVAEQDRQLAAVAFHAKALAGLAHLRDTFRGNVLAEHRRQLSDRGALAQETCQHVPREKHREHEQCGRDRDHVAPANPQGEVERDDDRGKSHDAERVEQRPAIRQREERQQPCGDHHQGLDRVGARWYRLDVAVEHPREEQKTA